MRIIVAMTVMAGCGLHDPRELLAERAADGDSDCGVVERPGYDPPPQTGEPDPMADAARACVLAALSESRPFRVLLEVPAPDNTPYLGWVDDGARIWQLSYCACADDGHGDVEENIRWTECTALEDLGENCRTKGTDLCLSCVEAP